MQDARNNPEKYENEPTPRAFSAEQLAIIEKTKAGVEYEEQLRAEENCGHQCLGNCRRVGCNCVCGEWHHHVINGGTI